MPTTKERLQEQFDRWAYMIEHYGWKLTVTYCDSVEDMPDDFTYEATAGTHHHFKYLEATIYVNLHRCEGLDDECIEYLVIHELVHLLVSPLQESSDVTPLEYTVTSLARIIKGLRNKERIT